MWYMSESNLSRVFEPIATILSQLNTSDEIFAFCRDLMTQSEMIEFARRFEVASMLSQWISYTEIQQQTSMSSTTIARINKYLKWHYGGYRKALSPSVAHHHLLPS
jgi:TrpR-related protein YerC/YecD